MLNGRAYVGGPRQSDDGHPLDGVVILEPRLVARPYDEEGGSEAVERDRDSGSLLAAVVQVGLE